MCAQLCLRIEFSFLILHCVLRNQDSSSKDGANRGWPVIDMVVRRHRDPDVSLRKEAMRKAPESTKKKEKNVVKDGVQGKIGKVYIPEQKVGSVPFVKKSKGVKRERREAKKIAGAVDNPTPKKQKQDAVPSDFALALSGHYGSF